MASQVLSNAGPFFMPGNTTEKMAYGIKEYAISHHQYDADKSVCPNGTGPIHYGSHTDPIQCQYLGITQSCPFSLLYLLSETVSMLNQCHSLNKPYINASSSGELGPKSQQMEYNKMIYRGQNIQRGGFHLLGWSQNKSQSCSP